MIVGRTPQRIYVDCTRTFQSNVHTGVDRLVRSLVKAMPAVGPTLDMQCTPVVFLPRRGFVALDSRAIARRFGSLGPTGAEPDRLRVPAHRLLARTGLLPVAGMIKGALKRASARAQEALRRYSRPGVSFAPGDILVLLDVAWDAPYWHDLELARRSGVELCQCVHDLILLNHPECVDPRVTEKFQGWWRRIAAAADYFICISQATWDEVVDHHRRQPIGNDPFRKLHGDSFRLGADLDRMFGNVAVRRELRELFNRRKFSKICLQVGLISPRKNYELALDAFEIAWRAGDKTALVIVGKYGWACDALLARIRSHAEFGRKLFWFENVGDDELDYCYRRATALVTTSYAEGFNLPIVEALSRETTVIATDLPAHREVGGAFAAYFPTHDAMTLAALVCSQPASGVRPGVMHPSKFRWPDWKESCTEFLGVIARLSREFRGELAGDDRGITRAQTVSPVAAQAACESHERDFSASGM